MKKALLLIDFQEGWRDKGYEYYLGDFKETIANAKKLLEHCRNKKIPVIFARHMQNEQNADKYAPRPLDCFVEGTPQTEIVKELKPLKGEPVVKKHRFSAFFGTELEKTLKKLGVEEVVFAGIMTNCCVRSTVMDAYYRDYKITVIKDACGSDSKGIDEFTFNDLNSLMYGIELYNTNEWIGKV